MPAWITGLSGIANIAVGARLCEIIVMKQLAALAALATIGGSAAMAQDKDWTADLQATAMTCDIPAEHLQFVGGSARWIAPEKTSYRQAKCIFDELK